MDIHIKMTTEPFSIREATIEDCATLAWLNQLFNGGDGDVDQMRRQMAAARVVRTNWLGMGAVSVCERLESSAEPSNGP